MFGSQPGRRQDLVIPQRYYRGIISGEHRYLLRGRRYFINVGHHPHVLRFAGHFGPGKRIDPVYLKHFTHRHAFADEVSGIPQERLSAEEHQFQHCPVIERHDMDVPFRHEHRLIFLVISYHLMRAVLVPVPEYPTIKSHRTVGYKLGRWR